MNNNIGIPKIPKHIASVKKINPPDVKVEQATGIDKFEHSWQLIFHIIASGIRNLPKLALIILLPLAAVTVTNIILESIPFYTLYGFKKKVVLFLVFLTSSYNSTVPRAIYWVVIFTFGKTLFRRIRREGPATVLVDYLQFPTHFSQSRKALGKASLYLLSIGAGGGFFAANYLSRNNRLDKMLVCYVVAIALINALSKGEKGILFTIIKLFYKDLVSFNKNAKTITTHQSYMLVSGVVLGLIGNTIFALIKIDNGGYVLGGILALVGLIMLVVTKVEVKKD